LSNNPESRRARRRPALAALLLAGASLAPAPACAWGALGHRYIGELAVRNFPVDLPAFLRTPEMAEKIGLLAQEPDISRNAGAPHDADRDPGHYIDVSDDGTILGGPKLNALPATRLDYDTALRAVGSNQYAAGFLPYNIMDGWQQLVKDFALLRMNIAAQKYAKSLAMTPEQEKGFAKAQEVRALLVVRDLGVWAHYVGDASQPLHASVHFNGWGAGENPQGFVVIPGLHARLETAFVNANISEADVAARIRPYRAGGDIQHHVQDYLTATAGTVLQTYTLDKAGAFTVPTDESRAFVAGRIAEGAAQLRDLVSDAWTAAGAVQLGYQHKESVGDIEAGEADPRQLD
jgi:hypothetical protein